MDLVLLCVSRIHFERILRGSSRPVERAWIGRAGRHCRSRDEVAGVIEEQNVERNSRVLHPEGKTLDLLEGKEHAAALIEMITPHEPMLARLLVESDLDRNADALEAVRSDERDQAPGG